MATVQTGDYTRTIIEGYWDGPDAEEGVQTDADQWEFKSAVGDKVTVEKIEPPVTVFKPGDRLRRKGFKFEITLADDGYLQHFSSGDVEYFTYSTEGGAPGNFTSEKYDKLELVEVPF